jgi:hypothetical protein
MSSNHDSAKSAEQALKHKYGLTLKDFNFLWIKAVGRCQVCRAPLKSRLITGSEKAEGAKLCHVDHCHKTGEVRGLLCPSCNVSIGKLGDDADSLRAAVRYLERPTTGIKAKTKKEEIEERRKNSPYGLDELHRPRTAVIGQKKGESLDDYFKRLDEAQQKRSELCE